VGWTLKTFDDLKFVSKNLITNPTATMDFGNGYGVEVERCLVGYNVVVLKNGEPTTKTYIPSKSLLKLTEDEVTDTMKKVQNFVKFTY
jgi:hypothetical protein